MSAMPPCRWRVARQSRDALMLVSLHSLELGSVTEAAAPRKPSFSGKHFPWMDVQRPGCQVPGCTGPARAKGAHLVCGLQLALSE